MGRICGAAQPVGFSRQLNMVGRGPVARILASSGRHFFRVLNIESFPCFLPFFEPASTQEPSRTDPERIQDGPTKHPGWTHEFRRRVVYAPMQGRRESRSDS